MNEEKKLAKHILKNGPKIIKAREKVEVIRKLALDIRKISNDEVVIRKALEIINHL